MTFKKTTAGFACKIAEKADAEWGCPRNNASWEQATDVYGNVIAYHDDEGWFVLECLCGQDVSEVVA